MKNIKVLGSGCDKCKTTMKLVKDQAIAMGVDIQIEKVEDLSEIVSYGVLFTPAVVIDDIVVHSGSIPTKTDIDRWLNGTLIAESPDNKNSSSSKCCG